MSDTLTRLAAALADRYRIERELGAGGMATVYLAEDLKHRRKVAVKVLRPELAAVLGAERFVQEITTTANLQHPNILPLFDSGEADGFLYYVMPFIDGESLRDRLDREKQLGVEEAVRIATEVADALDSAHQQGVIHRDIKPENILLHKGRPMVADFGIALAVSAAAGKRMTETGLSLGTPHYMSPEQATAEKDLTDRSDIYSLGSVLYEMLTGDPPHLGSSAQQIIMKIVTDEARPVSELRKTVPPHVSAAVAKSLEKLAADRFESAARFAEALTNPVFTLPTPMKRRATAASRRVPMTRLGWAVAAIATILAAWGWLRPDPPPPVLRYTTMPPGRWAESQFYTRIAISPDGSREIFVGAEQTDPMSEGSGPPPRALWVRSRDELQATRIAGTEDAWNPFFSPDGQQVGFLNSRTNSLDAVPIDGGPGTTVADGIGLSGGSWGTDGYIYANAPGSSAGLARVPEQGGDPEPVTTLDADETSHVWPDALPNGKGVLFTIVGQREGEGQIALLDLQSGTYRRLFAGERAIYAASNHVVYVTSEGTLMGVAFDPDALVVRGQPAALASGVHTGSRGIDLVLSTTGTLMYSNYLRGWDATQEVVWVTRDGSAEPIDPGWTGVFPGLALSPDGSHLAVHAVADNQGHILLKQLDRGPLTRLSSGGITNYRPAWTADGDTVAYVSLRGDNRHLYHVATGGGSPVQLLREGTPAINEVHFSPNGEWLVYRSGSGSTAQGRDIYGARLGSDEAPTPLVVTEFQETSPAVSPDGRWLAYVSNRGGQYDVYVRPFPNTADMRWAVSTGGGVEPVWARSGRELFYKSGGNLVAARIVADSTFVITDRQILFSIEPYGPPYEQTQRYAVAPDDQRFVMVRGGTTGPSIELVVVENFFADLKERVGN